MDLFALDFGLRPADEDTTRRFHDRRKTYDEAT